MGVGACWHSVALPEKRALVRKGLLSGDTSGCCGLAAAMELCPSSHLQGLAAKPNLCPPSCHPLCWLGTGVEPARMAGDVAAGTCLFHGVFLRASRGKPFPGVSSCSLATPGQDQDWHPTCSAGVFQPALPNSISGCACGAPSICGTFHLPLSPNLWSQLPSQRGSEGSGSGARLIEDWFLVSGLRLTGQGCASREQLSKAFPGAKPGYLSTVPQLAAGLAVPAQFGLCNFGLGLSPIPHPWLRVLP